MYFQKYGLRKTWLDRCLKNPISEDPSTTNMADVQNTAEIYMTAP